MTLDPREQKTIVEEHGRELFQDHIKHFLFFDASILKNFHTVFNFSQTKNNLHNWQTNLIYYFVHLCGYDLDNLAVNTSTFIML